MCSAQKFDLLCSILCSCKRIVLKNLTVLLEYIHSKNYLHGECSIRVYQVHIKYGECSIRVYRPNTSYYASIMLDADIYYAQNYAGIISQSLVLIVARLVSSS